MYYVDLNLCGKFQHVMFNINGSHTVLYEMKYIQIVGSNI